MVKLIYVIKNELFKNQANCVLQNDGNINGKLEKIILIISQNPGKDWKRNSCRCLQDRWWGPNVRMVAMEFTRPAPFERVYTNAFQVLIWPRVKATSTINEKWNHFHNVTTSTLLLSFVLFLSSHFPFNCDQSVFCFNFSLQYEIKRIFWKCNITLIGIRIQYYFL